MTVQTYYTIACDDCGKGAKTVGRGERPFGWGGPSRFRGSKFGEDFCPMCTRERIAKDWPEGLELPAIGDEIYIGTSLYIDHGEDDVMGGLATINGMEYNPGCKNDVNRVMVTVAEVPGRAYNYLIAKREEDKRRAQYGERRAYPDPDYS